MEKEKLEIFGVSSSEPRKLQRSSHQVQGNYYTITKQVLRGRPVNRAGRIPGGTIVLSRERTERSRRIPSFQKNERLERVLKIFGTISKRTERELLEKNG